MDIMQNIVVCLGEAKTEWRWNIDGTGIGEVEESGSPLSDMNDGETLVIRIYATV